MLPASPGQSTDYEHRQAGSWACRPSSFLVWLASSSPLARSQFLDWSTNSNDVDTQVFHEFLTDRQGLWGIECSETTSHLIYASTKLRSNQGRAFQESSQRVVRSGQLAYESFVTRQIVFQSSNVCDTVAGVLDLVFCFCGSCGVGRSVRSRSS